MSNKYVLSFLFMLVVFQVGIRAQQQAYLEVYAPSDGDTLDAIEKEHYGLFTTIDRFQWAAFSKNADGSLNARVLVLLDNARREIVVPRFRSIADLEGTVAEIYKDIQNEEQKRKELLSTQSDETGYTKNCIYVELLGQGVLYSINYEHRFTPSLSARIGFSSWSMPSFLVLLPTLDDVDMKSVPLMLNYLLGGGNSHLELGTGIIIYSATVNGKWFWGDPINGEQTGVLGTATVGYRYQPATKGLLFKIGFTPIFNAKGILPIGGLSVGLAF